MNARFPMNRSNTTRNLLIVGVLIAVVAATLLIGRHENSSIAQASTSPKQSIDQYRASLREIPVTEPVRIDAGRGLLEAPIDGEPAKVDATVPLGEFTRFLAPSDDGKEIEARFGLYSDASKGTMGDKGLTPTLTQRRVWVLIVRNTTVTRAGPVSDTAEQPTNDHDTIGIFDADTGEFIVGIQDAAADRA